jgi:hypothetical protein
MRCYGTTTSFFVTKVRDEVFAHFHAVTVKRDSSMRNWMFGLPGRNHCEKSPWCQRKLWACSSLYSSPIFPFSVSVSLEFPYTARAFFPERLSSHWRDLRRTFSNTKLDAYSLFLCRMHREIASGQKNQHIHPAALSFVHWLPIYASTIIYRCVALLQMLYQCQQESRKLWMPPPITWILFML